MTDALALDPLPLGMRRTFALFGLCIAAFLAILDSSIVSLLLPSMSRELHASPIAVAWVPNGYVIAYALLIPAAGLIGDRWGRRAGLAGGVALFAVGSLGCALAPSLGWLVAARVVQGAGGAGMLTLAPALILVEFAERRQWAFGVYIMVANLGGALGPIAGGSLATLASWRLVFWAQVPIALVMIALVAWSVRESRGRRRAPDLPGLALASVALVAGNLAILGTVTNGPARLAAGAVAISALVAFVIVETRPGEPMLPLVVFGDRLFAGATLAAATAWFATLSTGVYVAMYLQSDRGLSLLASSLLFLSWSAIAALAALATDRLVRAAGARRVVVAACSALVATTLPWALVRHDWPLWLPALLLAAFGATVTVLLTATLSTALTRFPAGEAGVASATYNATRQAGSSLGIAVPGAVLSALASGGAASGVALDGPLDAAFLVRGGAVAVGMGAALLLLAAPAAAGAEP
jgi:MFS transporter, DHA2 family, methylenomycin A resistance protein